MTSFLKQFMPKDLASIVFEYGKARRMCLTYDIIHRPHSQNECVIDEDQQVLFDYDDPSTNPAVTKKCEFSLPLDIYDWHSIKNIALEPRLLASQKSIVYRSHFSRHLPSWAHYCTWTNCLRRRNCSVFNEFHLTRIEIFIVNEWDILENARPFDWLRLKHLLQ